VTSKKLYDTQLITNTVYIKRQNDILDLQKTNKREDTKMKIDPMTGSPSTKIDTPYAPIMIPNPNEVDINKCCKDEEDEFDTGCHPFSVPRWNCSAWFIWVGITLAILVAQVIIGVVLFNQLKNLFVDIDKLPFFSIAQFGKGIFCVGQFAVGFFAFGQFAIGFVAIGQFAVGVFSISFIGIGGLFVIAGIGAGFGYGIGGGIIATYVAKAGGGLALFKCKKVGVGFHSIYPFFANGIQSPFRLATNNRVVNTTTTTGNSVV